MHDTDNAPGWASRSVARAQAVERALERAGQRGAGHYVRASWPAYYGWPAGEQLLCADTEQDVMSVAADWRRTHRTPKPEIAITYIGHRGPENTDDHPLLTGARKAADDYLMRKAMDGSLAPDVARDMAVVGFTVATRTLSTMRTQDGLSEDAIERGFQRKLNQARAAGDVRRIIAAEYTLAIWGGLRRDLATYLAGTGE